MLNYTVKLVLGEDPKNKEGTAFLTQHPFNEATFSSLAFL
jgi:hypothetical protein